MKWIIRIFTIIFSLSAMALMSGCSENEPVNPDDTPQKVRRTVLVYIVSSNSLGDYRFDISDINEMRAASSQIPADSRWLVYHAPRNEAPSLVEITAAGSDTLVHYDRGGSVTFARMSEVLDDVAGLAPAENYGLVLWGHGSGWIVNGLKEDIPDEPYDVSPKAYGDDSGAWMNIASLRAAVLRRNIDYIYFDCCHMGTVEVMYELRDAARYVVCGPAETPGNGMPYHKNLKYLCDGSKDALIEAAKTTYDEYIYSYDCIMSVIDLTGLDDLAAATAEIYSQTSLPHPGTDVTNYYGTTRQGNYIDFGEYVNALAESNGIDASEFNKALERTVIYKASPDMFHSENLGKWLPIYTASGLSTYVFNYPENFSANNNHYDTLQWAQDVVTHHLH